MKRIASLLTALSFPALVAGTASAAEAKGKTVDVPNTICPISGKPVDPSITTTYEDRTYVFADEAARAKFIEARRSSLYHRLGGERGAECGPGRCRFARSGAAPPRETDPA